MGTLLFPNVLLQLSCPRRQIQLCNPSLAFFSKETSSDTSVYAFPAGHIRANYGVQNNYEKAMSVKSTATNWPVLRECGQESLQFYWFRATVKILNCILDANSGTLNQVLKTDVHRVNEQGDLADRDESCLSAHVSAAFSGMRNEDVKTKNAKCFQDSHAGFYGEFVLRYGQQKVWREADAPNPREMNRKAATYHHWNTIESKGTRSLVYPITSIKGFE
eukprot:312362-Pelagomonas_calceolata.AAC.1